MEVQRAWKENAYGCESSGRNDGEKSENSLPADSRRGEAGKENSSATFVQISEGIMCEHEDSQWISDYYGAAYSAIPGYHKPPHFMEIPYWIPVLSGMLRGEYHERLHIVIDVASSIKLLQSSPGVLLFSTMEANKREILKIVEACEDRRIVMGGYIDPEEVKSFGNVKYLSAVEGIASHLCGAKVDAPPSYHLFEGLGVIPRLTLSTGCLFRCSFCTVPKTLRVVGKAEIVRQVEALRPLAFDLVYVDDKTFSQAYNWKELQSIGERIRDYNNDFKGFIIQTTPNVAAIPDRLKQFKDLGVEHVEIGVESLDNRATRIFRKPYNAKHLDIVTQECRRLGLSVIPNFVFGLPGQEYGSSVKWVARNIDVIPVVNVNFLASQEGVNQQLSNQLGGGRDVSGDKDQCCYQKSWLDESEELGMLQAVRAIFYLTTKKDFIPSKRREQLQNVSPLDVVRDLLGE